MHSETFDKYTEKCRNDKLSEMKSSLTKQQNIFQSATKTNESAVKASYTLAYILASRSKPFTDGEFIQECLIETAKIICPEKLNDFKNISLGRNTMAERVNELATDIRGQLSDFCKDFQAFSIAVDESTDAKDVAQLAVFIRGCNSNFEITEELLELLPMHGTTTGKDLFEEIENLLNKYELPLKKLVSLVTDGAPAMTGTKKGVVGRLNEKLDGKIENFHCIIHQEVLCGKTINLDHILKRVVSIVNFIRARGLNHRQFASLLADMDSEHEDLPYYTEIRWLSCHKVLKRFHDLRNEIITFLKMKDQDTSDIEKINFQQDLAFLVDITRHLNDLNLQLQGRKKLVTSMYDSIKAFLSKLRLWEIQLKNENLIHFQTCKSLNLAMPSLKFGSYCENIQQLKKEFDTRFQDFKKCEKKFEMFTDPFNFDVEQADENLQMELIELQCDSILKQKFRDAGVPEFYSYLPKDKYPQIIQFACQICAMFGSTYLCEQLFSLMKRNKTPERSRLTDDHLSSIMKIVSAQDLKPDINKICAGKRCQVSGKNLPFNMFHLLFVPFFLIKISY
jgi:hypothetical protein